ncbi:MAG: 30S ribosomal protein S24e [Candidatus Heimdallarchaeaceae archaeon]
MKITIGNKTENKLLERVEYEVEIDHQGEAVPTRDSVLSKIAAQINKDRNQVVLIKMEAKYGIGISNALIHAYESTERAILVEKEHIWKRSGLNQEKKEQ